MQHPEYPKVLKFRNAKTVVPQTPNLEQAKRQNTKKHLQNLQIKPQQNQNKIMTPRSTKNCTSDKDKMKSFRNLSIKMDGLGEQIHQEALKDIYGPNKSKENFCSNNESKPRQDSQVNREGKENTGLEKINQNMKKKLKPSNHILFKEVKATKSKPTLQKLHTDQHCPRLSASGLLQLNKQSANYAPVSLPVHQHTTLNHANTSLPYANDFESVTYQAHYKAIELTKFKSTLDNFSEFLSQAETRVTSQFSIKQKTLQSTLSSVNDRFSNISDQLEKLRQATIDEMISYTQRLNIEFNENLKFIHSMHRSVLRYQSDIDKHFDSIIKELDFSSFDKVIQQYHHKLEYFRNQVYLIAGYQEDGPCLFQQLKKLQKYIQKIMVLNCFQNNNQNDESNFMKKGQHLLLDSKRTARKTYVDEC